jgi:hypothetical protein
MLLFALLVACMDIRLHAHFLTPDDDDDDDDTMKYSGVMKWKEDAAN